MKSDQYEEIKKRHYRAVILILASNNSEIYINQRKIWKIYKDIDPSIKVYFTYGELDCELEDFDPESDLVYPEIKECYPISFFKTTNAMKHIHNSVTYDFFIRTNISTFWDFKKLHLHLNSLPTSNCYSGDGPLPNYTSDGYYLSGTDTIVTPEMIDSMLNNLDKVNFEVVEDSAMGLYFHGVMGVPMIKNRICFFEDITSTSEIEKVVNRIDEAIKNDRDHYRVKTLYANRAEIDMFIYKILLKKIYNLSLVDKDFYNSSLITGGSGMVGSNINFGIKPSSSELNIVDKNSIENFFLKVGKISCIVHLVALNLRDCENYPDKAIDVNINGTINMLKIAKERNIPFVLVSSGAVFSSNNENEIFNEKCVKNPNCMYGYTKSSSEEIALTYEKTIVIRTGWLFGGNQKTHYKFVENAVNNLYANTEVKASNNFYGSPTYVMDFIDKMKKIIGNMDYGIHHVVNSGYGSGYDIGIEIAKIINKKQDMIIPADASNIPNSGPKRSSTEMLESLNPDNILRDWKIALNEYLKKYIKEKFNKISDEAVKKKWSNREVCRLCRSYNLKVFFKLQPTPPANHFIKEIFLQETIPLDIAICNDCNHIQLIQIVDPEFQYSNYFYVSSTTYTMTNHLKKSSLEFTDHLGLSKEDQILEIGANDGVCVKHLLENGFVNTIGIDPAQNINKRHNLPIICDFFGSNIIQTFKENYKPFKLIFAFHCCAHIEDINDVFKTINELLDDSGSFIMEVGYFYEVFKNRLFDVIYHEHIDYHTVTAIQQFSLRNNLLLYKVKTNCIQGGSIQFYFCKNNYGREIEESVNKAIEEENRINLFDYENLNQWQNIIIRTGIDLNYILNGFKSHGKTIVGYGASAKSTTFLYQFKLTNKIIKYIIDDNIYKQDYFTPGLHIPIKSSNILKIDHVDYIIILSWNFTEEILSKLEEYRKFGVRIIVPFPEIKII